MKPTFRVEVASTAVLFVLFGIATVAYAQKEEHGQEARPSQPQHEQKQARPAQQQPQHSQQEQQQARPAPQQQQRAQQQPQQARPAQQQPQRAQQQQQQARPAQQQPQRAQQQQRQAPEVQRAAIQPAAQRTRQEARGWQQQRGWVNQGGGWQGNSSWQQGRAQNWQGQHRTWGQRGGYGGYFIPEDRFTLSFGSRHWFRMHARPMIVGGYPRFEYGGYSFMLVDPWPESWAENWYATDYLYISYDNGYYLYNRRDPGYGIAISVVL